MSDLYAAKYALVGEFASGVPYGVSTDDQPLVDMLVQLTEKIKAANGVLDEFNGTKVNTPPSNRVEGAAGSFALVRESIANIDHLRDRLGDLTRRIGRL